MGGPGDCLAVGNDEDNGEELAGPARGCPGWR